MYDWANSAMVTVIIASIFPIYFFSVAASNLAPQSATFRYSIATTISLVIIALFAPFLGAIADHSAIKKKLLGTFLSIGAVAVAMMFTIAQGDWFLAALLFVLANIGANGSFVFYDSLLPHIAGRGEIDRVSTAGYALGYIGGGLLLAGALALTLNPQWFGLPAGADLDPSMASLPARISFLAVATWWVVFSIPLFRHIPEPTVKILEERERSLSAARAALVRLSRTFQELKKYRNAFTMLLAFLIYNDGIGTIIRMAAIYGSEIGIDRGAVIGAILMVQFIGIPFAFLFGGLASRIGTKRAILSGLVVYAAISVEGYFMTTATHFFILAGLVGVVQGGTQALSRSLFGSMVPKHESGEFFGFFAVCEKFAGIFGPAIFALMIALTGSSRSAILSVIVFFVAGGILLLKVDVEEGRSVAREAEMNP
jgi:UMF1 family MFS transporter